MKKISIFLMFLSVASCTSINVKKLDPSAKVSHVCIEKNPDVIVSDFLKVIKKGFNRHGITTEVYQGDTPNHCKYNLTYTALKTWDIPESVKRFSTYRFLPHQRVKLEPAVVWSEKVAV